MDPYNTTPRNDPPSTPAWQPTPGPVSSGGANAVPADPHAGRTRQGSDWMQPTAVLPEYQSHPSGFSQPAPAPASGTKKRRMGPAAIVITILAVTASVFLGSAVGLSLVKRASESSTPAAPVVAATPDSVQAGGPISPVAEGAFIDAMRTRPTFSTWTDADIVALGTTTCGMFDDGAKIEDALSMGASRNLSVEDTGFVIGAAIMTHCPQHRPLLDPYLGG